MNWTITFYEDEYVRINTSGQYNPAKQRQMVQDILAHPQWQPGMSALFDHRQLDFTGVTFETMFQSGANHKKNDNKIGQSRTALLLSQGLAFGSGRQFLAMIEGNVSATLQLFTDEVEALKWLLD